MQASLYSPPPPSRAYQEATGLGLGTLHPIEEGAEDDTQAYVGTMAPVPTAKQQRLGFACERCGTSYTEKRSLARHRLESQSCNEGGRAMQHGCAYCPKSFKRNDLCKRHEREVHLKIKRPPAGGTASQQHSSAVWEASIGTEEGGPCAVPADHTASFTGHSSHTAADLAAANPPVGCQSDRHVRRIEATTVPFKPASRPELPALGAFPTRQVESHSAMDVDTNCPSVHQYGIHGTSADSNDSDSTSASSYDARRADQISTSSGCGTEYSAKTSNTEISRITLSSTASSTDATSTSTSNTANTRQKDDTASIISVSTVSSIKSRFSLPFRPHSSTFMAKRGASRRPRAARSMPPCPLCQKPFGDTIRDIRKHIGSHLAELKGEHTCDECKVGFKHRADLELHQQSAVNGKCGFEFDHVYECTGHHPPDELDAFISDHDRLKLCSQLWHWEQAKLHAFMARISEALVPQLPYVDSDRWSIGALRRARMSMSSLCSSIALRSAPDYGNYRLEVQLPVRDRVSSAVFAPVRQTAWKATGTVISQVAKHINEQLVLAAYRGDLGDVQDLVSKGANVNAEVQKISEELPVSSPGIAPSFAGEPLMENRKFVHHTPLLAAARGGDPEVIRFLLCREANVKFFPPGSGFGNALNTASASGNLEVANLLIDAGADVHAGYLKTPIYYAALTGNDQMVRLLLDRGADVNAGEGSYYGPALCGAAVGGHVNTIRLLLEYGADIDMPSNYGTATPLCHAALGGHVDAVTLLIERRADVNIYADGKLPLAYAFLSKSGKSDEVIACLYKAGAHALGAARQSLSPMTALEAVLVYAVTRKRSRAIELLLSPETNSTWRARDLQRPFCAAIRSDCKLSAKILLDHGADPNGADIDTSSPLQLAVKSDSADMVKLLVERGATVSDEGVYSALFGAICLGKIPTIGPLIQAGLDVNHRIDGISRNPRLPTLLCAAVDRRDVTDKSLDLVKQLVQAGAAIRIGPLSSNALNMAINARDHYHPAGPDIDDRDMGRLHEINTKRGLRDEIVSYLRGALQVQEAAATDAIRRAAIT